MGGDGFLVAQQRLGDAGEGGGAASQRDWLIRGRMGPRDGKPGLDAIGISKSEGCEQAQIGDLGIERFRIRRREVGRGDGPRGRGREGPDGEKAITIGGFEWNMPIRDGIEVAEPRTLGNQLGVVVGWYGGGAPPQEPFGQSGSNLLDQ